MRIEVSNLSPVAMSLKPIATGKDKLLRFAKYDNW